MLISPSEVKLKDGRLVTLRSLDADDAGLMLKHLIIVAGESHRNLNHSAEDWAAVSLEEEQKILADTAASACRFFLGAFSGKEIVGSLGLFGSAKGVATHSGHIGMGIRQSFSNVGLGGALISKAFEHARTMGIHRIDLTVRCYNLAGIALYERMGFERVGLLKQASKIDGEYVDEFLYQILI